jgi:hypothetical protein
MKKMRRMNSMSGEFNSGWSGPGYMLPTEDLSETEFGYEVDEKPKHHFFILVLQDDSLKITKVHYDSDYDSLWSKGIEEAKILGGFWSIFDRSGRFVDGNVVSRPAH